MQPYNTTMAVKWGINGWSYRVAVRFRCNHNFSQRNPTSLLPHHENICITTWLAPVLMKFRIRYLYYWTISPISLSRPTKVRQLKLCSRPTSLSTPTLIQHISSSVLPKQAHKLRNCCQNPNLWILINCNTNNIHYISGPPWGMNPVGNLTYCLTHTWQCVQRKKERKKERKKTCIIVTVAGCWRKINTKSVSQNEEEIPQKVAISDIRTKKQPI